MPKTPEYRHCRLRKTLSPTSCAVTVTYIPAKFARHGRVIKLKWEDGSWDDGWVVEQVHGMLSESELPDAHRAVRFHRQTTGDSLPRKSRDENLD